MIAAVITRKIMNPTEKTAVDLLAESIDRYSMTLGQMDDEKEQHAARVGAINDMLNDEFNHMKVLMENNFVALEYFKGSAMAHILFYRCTPEAKTALKAIQSQHRFVVCDFTTNVMNKLMEEDLDALEDAQVILTGL